MPALFTNAPMLPCDATSLPIAATSAWSATLQTIASPPVSAAVRFTVSEFISTAMMSQPSW